VGWRDFVVGLRLAVRRTKGGPRRSSCLRRWRGDEGLVRRVASSPLPQQGSQGPRHLQLYFYDTEDATLAHRARRSPDLDINIIKNILTILEGNPYVQTFNRLGSIPSLDDYVIELNTNVTPDQRRYLTMHHISLLFTCNTFLFVIHDF
jgi:hypothetical protein